VAVRGWLIRDAGGRAAGLGAFIRDISREKALDRDKALLERQLQQSQKMEAIGTLAGGIAHDFNNILGGIMGYAELARAQLDDPAAADRSLERLLQASHRAKELVRQILQFSRQSESGLKPLAVAPAVRDALRLLRATIPTHIEIRPVIPDDDLQVLADATRIHQVLMNLCANAAHAMGEEGGELTVSLDPVDLAAPLACHGQELPAGAYVRLQVADTGCGMGPADLERIFDPYYTTKPVGEGTGLGLAVLLGIVRGHRGGVAVQSAPGRGTVFSVYLPRIEAGLAGGDDGVAVAPGGDERVLFVDDEEFYVDLARDLLGALGYRVTAVRSGPEALERFGRAPRDFDLVITDQTMPKLTARELARRLRVLRPDVPIILCTGFSEAVQDRSPQVLGVSRVLQKPMRLHELAVAIREVLAAAAAGGTPGHTADPD